jgi:hypothetical protein
VCSNPKKKINGLIHRIHVLKVYMRLMATLRYSSFHHLCPKNQKEVDSEPVEVHFNMIPAR